MAACSISMAYRKALQAQWRLERQILALQSIKPRQSSRSPIKSFSTTHATFKATSSPQPYQSKVPPAADPIRSPEEKTVPSGAQPTSITSAAQNIAQSLRTRLPKTTETYVAYGGCERLLKECARQADYKIPQAAEKGVEIPKTKDGQQLGVGDGWWYSSESCVPIQFWSACCHFLSRASKVQLTCPLATALGLPPTFNTWAQVTFLHMYLLTVRIRCFPPDAVTPWHQHLIDHFSNLAEDKMIITHKIDMRAMRSRYLKDLFNQWRGIQAGYDEGLVKGDAVLATAVWRNVFGADPEVDFRRVGEVVSYVRHVLVMLQGMPDSDIASGEIMFGANPGSEKDVVRSRSKMMDSKGA